MNGIARLATCLAAAWLICGFTGCAATMAAHQPGMKDISVLQPGTPRSRVVAELGMPLDTRPTDRGGVDVFAFKQGYSRVNRTARALGHATGTIVTAGVWEIAGIPLESWFDGTEVKMEVYYGPGGEVEGVTVFEGVEAFHGRILAPHVQLASAPSLYPDPSYTMQTPPPQTSNPPPAGQLGVIHDPAEVQLRAAQNAPPGS
jgi:hypothetical protein